MNEHSSKPSAEHIAANLNFLSKVEEETLRDLLLSHSQKMLDSDLSHEVEEMIRINPLAASIWQEFQATDQYLNTEPGRDWLESTSQRILSNVLDARGFGVEKASAGATAPQSLFDLLATLRDSISTLFASHASLVTASGREAMERSLNDGKTRIVLKSDSAGRLWLHVTSTANEFAGRSFQVDVERTPALLSFSEVTPGVHDARVCVSDELAAALSSGGELKLTPI